MKSLRFDLVFSYWIFAWFILYLCNITTYSPKFAFILGLIENFFILIMMIIKGTKRITILYFIIINFLIKVLPIYYLRAETIRMKDIYMTFLLFLIFIIWLYINNISLIENIKIIYNSLVYGENKTPFMKFFVGKPRFPLPPHPRRET
jgi:hypothetical protein